MSDVVKYVPVHGGDEHIKQLAVDPYALEEWIRDTEETLSRIQEEIVSLHKKPDVAENRPQITPISLETPASLAKPQVYFVIGILENCRQLFKAETKQETLSGAHHTVIEHIVSDLDKAIAIMEQVYPEMPNLKQLVYSNLGLPPSMFEDANDNSEIT